MDLHGPIADYISAEILKDKRRAIGPEEPLISSGLIDSFSVVDLALFVESEFAVRIQDHELNAEQIDTLDALVKLIKTRLA